MANRYGLYSCLFDGGANNLVLNQVRSVGHRSNKGIFTAHPSGSLDPAAHLMSTARPVVQVATNDLLTLFGDANVPLSITSGLYCSQGATFLYRRRVEGGGYSASSDHITQVVESGFLNCSEFSAEAESQNPAEAALEFMALSLDGLNPFTMAFGQAIPGSLTAPAFNSAFYHGPVYLNSNQITGLTRTRVRPGIGFAARYADGGSFPRAACASIAIRQPAIELEFINLDALNATFDLFMAAFSTTLAVYFQRGSTNNDGRVAAATSQHLKVSAAAGSFGADDVTVRDNEDGTASIVVMPTGTLSLSVASTIP